MKGAVQVLRHGAAQVRHFDIVVVELVEQMCGELTAAAPLISFRDHTNEDRIRRLRNGFCPKTGQGGHVIAPRRAIFGSSGREFVVRG